LSEDGREPEAKPPRPSERRRPSFRWIGIGFSVVLMLLAAAALTVRYGVLAPQGRMLVEQAFDGLPLGPLGRLHIEGLQGDVWRAFSVRRLAIVDARGVWLDARNVRLRWDWPALLVRRLQIDALDADRIQVQRPPLLAARPAGGPSGPPPVSIGLTSLRAQVETLPAASLQRGLFQVTGGLDVERAGGLSGQLHGESLLRRGDRLDSRFDLGPGRLMIVAKAQEAAGGALAGLAGLAANQAFGLDLDANGAADAGKLHLLVLSGAQVVAQIDGGWTAAGGSGQGRISLAPSRWTAGLKQALGPELRLSGAGRGLGADRYDLALQASCDNASLHAAGMVDARRAAAPDGLKIETDVVDLSRVIRQPAMGRAGLNGTLSGGLNDWRLDGVLSVERLSYASYSLARVSGPATLSLARREWRLKAALVGGGGQGQGVLAALAGPAPKVRFDGQRLADGRLLLTALDADGSGLKLQVSGARSLLGALSLKGEAQISNLAAARAGAHGQAGARWSASQARAGGAWTLQADAIGQGLTSGNLTLDRLLGSKPTLHLAAAYDRGALSVSKGDLIGAEARLSATGGLGAAGDLKFALNWSAAGPLIAGPLEIAGKARGSGALTGALAAPRADLLADFDRIELPSLTLKAAHVALSLAHSATGFDGLLNLTAGGDYGPARARTALSVGADGIVLTDLDAAAGGATATGSIALRDAAPSAADLTVTVGPGAFATQGHASARIKLADAAGVQTANVDITAQDYVARGSDLAIHQASFRAAGPVAHLPYKAAVDAAAPAWPLKLDGGGIISQTEQGYLISFAGSGRARQADFRTLSPAQVTIAGSQRTAKLELAVGGGMAQILADQTDQSIGAQATLSGVDLAALGEDMVGKVSASLTLEGRGSALHGALDAELQGARSRDAEAKLALDGRLHAVLTGPTLTLDATAGAAQSGETARVDLTLPAEASAAPFRIALARTQPMAGRFSANGELQPIWDLFFGGQSLGGALTADGEIAGTLAAPKLTGHASLANGRFEDAGSGLKLRNVTAALDLSQSEVALQRFAGMDAKNGSIAGQGRISLEPGGQSTLTLNAKNFLLIDTDDASASATGSATLVRGADGRVKLTGALAIDQATISAATRQAPGVITMDVVERNRPTGQGGALAETQPTSPSPDIDLDIKLSARRKVYVRGLGLNAELSLNAQVGGSLSAPALTGVARVVRGYYDFAGKRFEIDDQGTIDLGPTPDQIRLDLSASWQTPSLTAVIKIKGTAAKPVISLTSTPVLPQDEVLSQVLFGSSAAQLSPVEAAQLAAAVATLATGGGFDVMGGLSRFARLDRLALGGGDSATGVTVSGGKYIGNNVYLELTGGGRQPPSAQLEFRASRAFSFISQVGGLGGAKLSVRWRRDYGRAKGIGKPAAKRPNG
jgi:translocation and assembly module TamB